jgi:hypothetical protein
VLNLKDCGRVAQLAEQCPFKAWVAGSNPAALTKISAGRVFIRIGSFDQQRPTKSSITEVMSSPGIAERSLAT